MSLNEGKLTEIEKVLNKMKNAGIPGGLVRSDGVLIKATIALGDVGPTIIARAANISDAMLRREGNTQKEVEIGFEKYTIVIVPISTYIFFGIAKTKEEKK
ncbi:MAG: hypothetical protein QW590_03790, partial [Candidatus Bilamarchaeaceae archaeon]